MLCPHCGVVMVLGVIGRVYFCLLCDHTEDTPEWEDEVMARRQDRGYPFSGVIREAQDAVFGDEQFGGPETVEEAAAYWAIDQRIVHIDNARASLAERDWRQALPDAAAACWYHARLLELATGLAGTGDFAAS